MGIINISQLKIPPDKHELETAKFFANLGYDSEVECLNQLEKQFKLITVKGRTVSDPLLIPLCGFFTDGAQDECNESCAREYRYRPPELSRLRESRN